jgi:hypothetical protein
MSPTLVTMSTDISASLLDLPQARKGRERSQGRPGVGLLCRCGAPSTRTVDRSEARKPEGGPD